MTSAEYLAIRDDPDNARVMAAAARPFAGSLSAAERREAMEEALLRCLGTFDAARGQKFTTSLHRLTVWACLNAARGKARARRRHALSLHEVAEPAAPAEAHGDVLEALGAIPDEDARLLREAYFGGERRADMARARGRGGRGVERAMRRAREAFAAAFLGG